MVDLSRPRRPRPEATDVAGLAREVVALAANAARGSDVKVAYEGPERETVARCDGGQMRQVALESRAQRHPGQLRGIDRDRACGAT